MSAFNINQQESVAKGVMKLTETIAAFHPTTAGNISSSNTSILPESNVRIDKIRIATVQNAELSSPSTPQDTLAFLLEQCQRWRQYQLIQGVRYDHIWDSFGAISQSLQKRGFLDGLFSLVHGDLQDYNLLVKVKDDTTVHIPGVIDWVTAMFAPQFVAYRAPSWMWLNGSATSSCRSKENSANYEPQGDMEKHGKAYFMTEASEKWKKFALPEAKLARRMMFILKHRNFKRWEIFSTSETSSILRIKFQ